jgi:signal peptidase
VSLLATGPEPRTSLSAEIDALVRPRTVRPRLGAVAAIDAGLRAASVFCASTVGMLGLWILLPVVFLGWSATAIETGSMRPSVTRGDVVLLRDVERHPIGPGSVVRFRIDGVDGTTVHRVDSVDAQVGTYITRGDANRQADSTAVPFEQVDGVGTLLVPLVGYPMLWLRELSWGPLAALAVGLAVVLGPGLRAQPEHRLSSSVAALRPLTAAAAVRPPVDELLFERRTAETGR